MERKKTQITINASGFYQQDKETMGATLRQLEEIQNALDQAYQRWEQLE